MLNIIAFYTKQNIINHNLYFGQLCFQENNGNNLNYMVECKIFYQVKM